MVTAYVYSIILEFLLIPIVDLLRKCKAMEVCHNMLNPWKDPEQTTRNIIPVIDISSPTQIQNWFSLKMVLLDIGRKFYVRTQIFTSFIIGFNLIFCFFLLLAFFDIIADDSKKLLVALAAFDLIVAIFFSLIMLNLGAKINDFYYQDQKACLRLIRTLHKIEN